MTGILVALALFLALGGIFWAALRWLTANGMRLGKALNTRGSPDVLRDIGRPTSIVNEAADGWRRQVHYAGRPESAAPATGSAARHKQEQAELLRQALGTGRSAGEDEPQPGENR